VLSSLPENFEREDSTGLAEVYAGGLDKSASIVGKSIEDHLPKMSVTVSWRANESAATSRSRENLLVATLEQM
jgi:hypothetical protein